MIKIIYKQFFLFLLLLSLGYSQSAPVITSNGGGSTASISYAENNTSTITTVTSTDADNSAINPSFAAQDIATSADGAYSVYAADMDGDGDMDIISSLSNNNTIAWYENNGASDPTWTAQDIATSADAANSVYAADMDGEGDMDILSASYSDDTIIGREHV